jgi:hypothetical protein
MTFWDELPIALRTGMEGRREGEREGGIRKEGRKLHCHTALHLNSVL